MTADDIIESYVTDVVRLLPRKQRRDVALELQALLHDEVAAKEGDPESAAREVVAGLGRPAEVAARYGPPVSLIDPADSRWFLTLAGGGAAVIVFGAVLNAFLEPGVDQPAEQAKAISDRWPTAWLTVFAWCGVLAVGFAIAAWARRRWPQLAKWKPRPAPNDRISRVGRIAAVLFYVVGTAILINPAWFMQKLFHNQAVVDAFTYEDSFVRVRGPILLALITLGLVIQVVLIVQGQWYAWSRRTDLANSIAVCVGLTLVLATGPVFRAEPTDQAMRGAMAIIVLVTLVDVGLRVRRDHVRLV